MFPATKPAPTAKTRYTRRAANRRTMFYGQRMVDRRRKHDPTLRAAVWTFACTHDGQLSAAEIHRQLKAGRITGQPEPVPYKTVQSWLKADETKYGPPTKTVGDIATDTEHLQRAILGIARRDTAQLARKQTRSATDWGIIEKIQRVTERAAAATNQNTSSTTSPGAGPVPELTREEWAAQLTQEQQGPALTE